MDEIDFGYVFASKMLVELRLSVGFMYREEGVSEYDSGWRFLSGLEDEEMLSDPECIDIYNIDDILACDESIVPYLFADYGSAFEKDGFGSEAFRPVEDFSFGGSDAG